MRKMLAQKMGNMSNQLWYTQNIPSMIMDSHKVIKNSSFISEYQYGTHQHLEDTYFSSAMTPVAPKPLEE